MTDNPNGSADNIGLIGLSMDDRIDRIDQIIWSNTVFFFLFLKIFWSSPSEFDLDGLGR